MQSRQRRKPTGGDGRFAKETERDVSSALMSQGLAYLTTFKPRAMTCAVGRGVQEAG